MLNPYNLAQAIQDFHRARQQAVMKEFMARLTGEKIELLSYDEVRRTLKAAGSAERGLREVPLEAIVGSVNRYTDFTRDFLPKDSVEAMRWARVEMAVSSSGGLPPIEVYKIGDVYFVKDGNHRVSVARQMGTASIEAYVTEVHTRVPLSPDTSPEELIVKAEYASFLEHTSLGDIRPEADLSVTAPGQYPALEEHIAVHRYYMGLEEDRFVPEAEAAAHWYDAVYQPVAEVIARMDLLSSFPGRTVTDMYLWLAEHRAELEEQFGREIRPEDAASDLTEHYASQPGLVSRIAGAIRNSLVPSQREEGPTPGQGRKEKLAARQDTRMFSDILVPVNGTQAGWNALEQAIVVARQEGASLHGLHIVPHQEEKDGPAAQAVEAEFNRRCEAAGIDGTAQIAVGDVTRTICEHARWSDLVVVNLAYPPAPQPLAALSSGFKALIKRCPRPLLAAPGVTTPLENALLAYDGSPKSQEALFIATYLGGQWKIPLAVMTVFENGRVNPETLAEAWNYLEAHEVGAEYIKQDTGPVAQAILAEAEARSSDLILMGGYVHGSILDVVLGNEVDRVLRESHRPLLICR